MDSCLRRNDKIMSTKLTDLLNIKYPIIQAPMFLVSNVEMVKEAMKCGIAGCIPALNYRTLEELKAALKELKAAKVEGGSFGFNLIVNKSNIKYKSQLEIICEEGCDFIITSLGNPKETIEEAHKRGIKVFCDVVDYTYAQKVESLGADAIIAVNNEAGGHRGALSPKDLITELVSKCNIPIISAGGVGTKADVDKMLSYGAAGVSVGSPFIASVEANVTDEYKQACVDYGANDIVMTERISGTPCAVINTPYVQKVGTKATWLESILNKHKKLKKWVKMVRFGIGMRATEKAAKEVTYKTVWVAGPSIEHTRAILPVKAIVEKLI
ncbi:nitronate monooxygenase [Flavobacteriaceae bacterium XHP0103]|uniref:NAD(P)H-dependent flavin oxidoreductase n=1 Tax=Marixanthotalea marina TaxID=2844359 RepID=UPI002989F146|nr:nitronate monooxygenase [Marixanthotalea marina]MBU3822972.1 nitronate monooxygenase [Marixanthotalea marina]